MPQQAIVHRSPLELRKPLRHGGGRLVPPHVAYLVLGGLAALLLCVLTPPFEVADELQHFFRSYQLSRGQVWGSVQHGTAGDMLPAALPELVEHFLGSRDLHRSRVPGVHPLADTWAQMARPLEPDRQEFVVFTQGLAYPPLGYLPQAAAIAVARTLGAPPLAMFYAARFANAAVALALVTWGLRLLPVGREAALAAALLPIWQFQLASLSQDAAILGASVIVTALGLRALFRRRWSRGEALLALIAGVSLAVMKPPYLPLLAIGLPACIPLAGDTPAERRDKFHRLAWQAIVVATALAAIFAWSHATAWYATIDQNDAGANVQRQLVFVAAHPIGFLKMLVRTPLGSAPRYALEFTGVLGWQNFYLPAWIYVVAPLTFLAAASPLVARPASPGWPRLIWMAAVAIACLMLIEAVIYLIWSPVGAFRSEGVQGRYFLPVLPLIGAFMGSLGGGRGAATAWAYRCALLAVTLITVATAASVAIGYRVI